MTHVWITRFLPALFVLIFFFYFIYKCTCYYIKCKFFRHPPQSFFLMYMVITDFFSVLLNLLGGIFVFAMVVIHPPLVSYCTWLPTLYSEPLVAIDFYKSQILREKKKYFLNEKVVLKYLNTSLCCKIIITF